MDFQAPEEGKKRFGQRTPRRNSKYSTCDYPNRLNLTPLTTGFLVSFEISRVFAKKFRFL